MSSRDRSFLSRYPSLLHHWDGVFPIRWTWLRGEGKEEIKQESIFAENSTDPGRDYVGQDGRDRWICDNGLNPKIAICYTHGNLIACTNTEEQEEQLGETRLLEHGGKIRIQTSFL